MKSYSILLISIVLLFSCNKDQSDIAINDNGTGGSFARFVLVDHFLYVIDQNTLTTYDVSNDAQPVKKDKQDVGFGIETLFPFEDYLLIGSNTGMYIYQTDANGVPTLVSNFEHIEACDPVVSNGDFAYVTLRSNRFCGGDINDNNRLEIINIQNPLSPSLEHTMFLDDPKGLAIEDSLLFICVSNIGVNVYDVSSPTVPQLIANINGFTANDVIARNNQLLVVCPDGLRQFDFSDVNNITNLSNFAVNF